MAHGGAPDEAHQDKRVSAAMDLARQAMSDPHQLQEGFDRFKSLFTIEELSALFAFIAFVSGATRFGVLADLSEDDVKK